jgi:hypothetical protein
VGASAAGEVEVRPGLDRLQLADRAVAVVGVERRGLELLLVIAAELVVDDDVGVDPDPDRVRGLDRRRYSSRVPYLVRTEPFWSNSPRSNRSYTP